MSEYFFDLTDSQLWSVPALDSDNRVLLDPLKGVSFSPHAVPGCIDEDALLSGGLEFLRRRAATIRLKTFYPKHSAEGDLTFGWRGQGFERHVRRCDYFGFESFGSPVEPTEVGRSSFAKRVRLAVAQSGSPAKCFPMDIARIGSSPLEGGIIEAHEAFFHENLSFEEYAAWYGIRNLREWIMLARLGLKLRDGEGKKARKLRVFSLFGRYHQDLTRKAAVLGMRSEALVKNPLSVELLEEVRMVRLGVVAYSHFTRFDESDD